MIFFWHYCKKKVNIRKKEQYNDRPRDKEKNTLAVADGFFAYIQYLIETKFK